MPTLKKHRDEILKMREEKTPYLKIQKWLREEHNAWVEVSSLGCFVSREKKNVSS